MDLQHFSSLPTHIIVSKFKQKKVQFPYYCQFKTVNDAEKALIECYNFVPHWQNTPYTIKEKLDLPLSLKFKDDYLWLSKDLSAEQHIDWVTDYFTENSRIHSHRKGKPSPYNSWYQYGSYVKKAVEVCKHDLTLANLREALYKDHTVPECPHERITFLTSLFKFLNDGKLLSVFDGSAGWGDRLLAAMISGCESYYGIDPNMASQAGFKKMVSMGKRLFNLTDDYIVEPFSMPDAFIPETLFDIAFLSPPSFDSECYSADEGQSINRWTNQKTWYQEFLFPTVLKCWEKIKVGGYFIVQSILINEISIYLMAHMSDAVYCGPIAVEGNSRFKPMWIWQKGVVEDESIHKLAKIAYAKKYVTKTYMNVVTRVSSRVEAEILLSEKYQN